jgi:hypothetical protein
VLITDTARIGSTVPRCACDMPNALDMWISLVSTVPIDPARRHQPSLAIGSCL